MFFLDWPMLLYVSAIHVFIAEYYSIITMYTKIVNMLPCAWALGYILL